MRGPAARLVLSWLPVVALCVLVVSLWDLQYTPGGCSDVLTDASEERFDRWGWVLRGAQWAWALGAVAWLLRGRLASDVPAPGPWRMAVATVAALPLVGFSGALLGQEGLVLFLGLLILGGLALIATGVLAGTLLARTARPPGFAAAVWSWLAICLLLAPLGLGVLTASDAGTLC